MSNWSVTRLMCLLVLKLQTTWRCLLAGCHSGWVIICRMVIIVTIWFYFFDFSQNEWPSFTRSYVCVGVVGLFARNCDDWSSVVLLPFVDRMFTSRIVIGCITRWSNTNGRREMILSSQPLFSILFYLSVHLSAFKGTKIRAFIQFAYFLFGVAASVYSISITAFSPYTYFSLICIINYIITTIFIPSFFVFVLFFKIFFGFAHLGTIAG